MLSKRTLDFKWLSPYEIIKVNTEKGYYFFKELGFNKTRLRQLFFKLNLKLFYVKKDFIYNAKDALFELYSSNEDLKR